MAATRLYWPSEARKVGFGMETAKKVLQAVSVALKARKGVPANPEKANLYQCCHGWRQEHQYSNGLRAFICRKRECIPNWSIAQSNVKLVERR